MAPRKTHGSQDFTSRTKIKDAIKQVDSECPDLPSAYNSDVNGLDDKSKSVRKAKRQSASLRGQIRIDQIFGEKNQDKTKAHEVRRIESVNEEDVFFDANGAPIRPVKSKTEEATEKVKQLTREYEQKMADPNAEVKGVFVLIGDVFKAMNERDAAISTEIKQCTNYVRKELEYVKKEVESIKRNDEVEEIKMIDNCRTDLKKVWIRFKYRQEAERLRDEGNYPMQLKNLLSRMNIKFNLGILPIETAYFQTRRFGGPATVPELTMLCIFASHVMARRVKNDIRAFNEDLMHKGRLSEVRYDVSVSWSQNVWNIMRVCIELQKYKHIDRHLITNEGVKAEFTEKWMNKEGEEESKTVTLRVNSGSQLDALRVRVNDFNYNVPASMVYTTEYFASNEADRKKLREQIVGDDETEEMEVVETSEKTMIERTGLEW
jgi:hypothetical protein